ncbi:MAG: ABC transporter ATP-binding protein [Bacteroidota bacterium]
MRIDAHELQKRYHGEPVLDLPQLAIPAGDAFGLVGNNGAGKTTFLRLALDLLKPSQGHVEIDGARVATTTAWKARTGAYLDPSFLIDYLTPEEFFDFTGQVYGLAHAEVTVALERFAPFFNGEVLGQKRYLRDLSMGNRKKVGIVAALLHDPDLVILDEPFANLDPSTQIRLKSLLRQLNERRGTTLIVSSHDLNHVTEVCGRIAVLERGRIVQDLATSEATLTDLERYFTVEDAADLP